MIKKIVSNVYKLVLSSNIYFLDLNKKIIIDTGDRKDRGDVKLWLSKLVDFERVDVVIFTHLHYDHTGNADLFSNAEFYASKKAVEDLEKVGVGAVLNKQITTILRKIEIKPLPKKLSVLRVIETPGHTAGSVCLLYEKEKVLFSGDTVFDNNILGRVDLPTSKPEKMSESLMNLVSYDFKHLCPGHDCEAKPVPKFIKKAGLEKKFGY
ncbi:MBL fold metallo-hydrolase [Candidatus Woesearchaeota archaeon]|nr:MBL fold metallo-hydrolase [Candidatus Woesearchaeota archaeon]